MPAEVAARLQFIRSAGDPAARRRAAIEVARTLPIGDLKDWYEGAWFKEQGIEGSLIERIIRSRWLAADPSGFMDFCLGKDREDSYQVVKDWAELDPAATLAYALASKRKNSLLSWMAEDLAKADPGLVLTKLPEISLSLGTGSNHVLAEVLDTLARAAPDQLRAVLTELPPDLRGPAGTRLAGELLRRDFSAGLAELAKMDDGREYFVRCATGDRGFIQWGGTDEKLMELVSKHADSLPEGWMAAIVDQAGPDLTASDPGRWLEVQAGTMGLSEDQAESLRESAFRNLAGKDLKKAMELFASREWTESNQSERRESIHAIAGALKDAAQAQAWIAGLADEQEREMAGNDFAMRSEPGPRGKTTPAQFLDQMLADSAMLSSGQRDVTRYWGSQEAAEFTRGFDQLPSDQRAMAAHKLVGAFGGSELPVSVRAHALGYLLEHPGDGSSSSGASDLMRRTCQLATGWADQDPVAASDWVKSLPASDERLWAAKNVALRWAEYEPAAARRWVASLAVAERTAVEASLQERR